MRTLCELKHAVVLTLIVMCATFGFCQQSGNNQDTVEGTVVSSSRDTLVVRTDDNRHQLFVFDQYTTRPRNLAAGTRVSVSSTPTDETGVRMATTVTVLGEGASTTASASTSSSQTGPAGKQAPPPPEVRDLERDIRRQVRKWRLGVRGGVGLDPELILLGVHSQIGPIFKSNISFRPNAEFAWGEVTDMISLNLEAIYRLPVTARHGRWSAYVGGGPSLNFIHQNFQGGRDIDFGNFDYETGLNILSGLQFRKGTFFEVKTSLYSKPAPVMRLIFGYTF